MRQGVYNVYVDGMELGGGGEYFRNLFICSMDGYENEEVV